MSESNWQYVVVTGQHIIVNKPGQRPNMCQEGKKTVKFSDKNLFIYLFIYLAQIKRNIQISDGERGGMIKTNVNRYTFYINK